MPEKILCLTQRSKQRHYLRECAMRVSTAMPKLMNTLAPINKLPPEILGTIPKFQDDQTAKDLVAISSVCSYWRNTFTATPSLWTTLDGKGLEKSRAWVERSGVLPIRLQVRGSPDSEVLEFLAPHSHRFEVVNFPKLGARDLLFMENHLPKALRPGPLLHYVCVNIYGLEWMHRPYPSYASMTGEFPSLESLRIDFFPMSITNLRAPNLRNLKLLGDFDLEIVLDLLESSPLLETLGLDLHEDVSVSNGRMVSLEKVTQANFSSNGFKILQYLLLPASKDIIINIEPHLNQLLGTMGDCNPFLSQALDSFPPLRQVQSVSFRPEDDSSSQSAFIEGPHGTVELLTDTHPFTFFKVLRVFTERSTESIQELKLPNVDSPLICLAENTLESLGSLRSVYVHGPCVSECFFRLGTSYCLQLKEITARDPDYVALETFVRRRSEAGIAIRRLVLESDPDTQVDMEAMERLRKYVDDVLEVRGYLE